MTKKLDEGIAKIREGLPKFIEGLINFAEGVYENKIETKEETAFRLKEIERYLNTAKKVYNINTTELNLKYELLKPKIK